MKYAVTTAEIGEITFYDVYTVGVDYGVFRCHDALSAYKLCRLLNMAHVYCKKDDHLDMMLDEGPSGPEMNEALDLANDARSALFDACYEMEKLP